MDRCETPSRGCFRRRVRRLRRGKPYYLSLLFRSYIILALRLICCRLMVARVSRGGADGGDSVGSGSGELRWVRGEAVDGG